MRTKVSTPHDERTWWTKEQICEHYQLSLSTVNRLLSSEGFDGWRLPSVRIGGSVRVHQDDLADMERRSRRACFMTTDSDAPTSPDMSAGGAA